MSTVLLVDDNDEVREVLWMWAERLGFEVVGEARNGREAIDSAARLHPDVIILDQEMPEMTGIEALPRLRRRVPDSLIVFYCSGDPKLQEEAMRLGAVAYLTKRDSPKTVMNSVADLVGTAGSGVRS